MSQYVYPAPDQVPDPRPVWDQSHAVRVVVPTDQEHVAHDAESGEVTGTFFPRYLSHDGTAADLETSAAWQYEPRSAPSGRTPTTPTPDHVLASSTIKRGRSRKGRQTAEVTARQVRHVEGWSDDTLMHVTAVELERIVQHRYGINGVDLPAGVDPVPPILGLDTGAAWSQATRPWVGVRGKGTAELPVGYVEPGAERMDATTVGKAQHHADLLSWFPELRDRLLDDGTLWSDLIDDAGHAAPEVKAWEPRTGIRPGHRRSGESTTRTVRLIDDEGFLWSDETGEVFHSWWTRRVELPAYRSDDQTGQTAPTHWTLGNVRPWSVRSELRETTQARRRAEKATTAVSVPASDATPLPPEVDALEPGSGHCWTLDNGLQVTVTRATDRYHVHVIDGTQAAGHWTARRASSIPSRLATMT